jgi:hypothetical protein
MTAKTTKTALDDDVRQVLSNALQSICFTRDYVGEDLLPAIEGWSWYDSGKEIAALIPDDMWTRQFEMRIMPCSMCNAPNPRHNEDCPTLIIKESDTATEGGDGG